MRRPFCPAFTGIAGFSGTLATAATPPRPTREGANELKTIDNAALVAARGLRRWRREAELTQAELAEACGVSRDTVVRWESPNSTRSMGVVHLLRLCAQLGTHPAHLWQCILGKGGGADGHKPA